MSHASATEGSEKLDLVPMIDVVMLLLVFFILTSSFRSEEQRISALLSTQGGPVGTPTVEQPDIVRVVILPGNGKVARVRLGGGQEILLDGAALAAPPGAEVEATITAFHAAIATRLSAYEKDGPRAKQTPVEIHCATRLPWRHAIAVYDAVRSYEQARLPDPTIALVDQRNVAFGAPTVRRTPTDNERDEIDRLERLR